MKAKLLLGSSQQLMMELLADYLRRDGRYEVVGQAVTGPEVLRLCRQKQPHVAILGVRLPELGGAALTEAIRTETPEVKVLLFSSSRCRRTLGSALHSRPHGFISKNDSLDTLDEALAAITRGCRFFTPEAGTLMFQPRSQISPLESLSTRERLVLQLTAAGLSRKEIALRLDISPRTVETHRGKLREKLKARSTAALIRVAWESGLTTAA